jgi:hypothetical protein
MIIRTTSKQRTGGVTEKKDQPEWMTNGHQSAAGQSYHSLAIIENELFSSRTTSYCG